MNCVNFGIEYIPYPNKEGLYFSRNSNRQLLPKSHLLFDSFEEAEASFEKNKLETIIDLEETIIDLEKELKETKEKINKYKNLKMINPLIED